MLAGAVRGWSIRMIFMTQFEQWLATQAGNTQTRIVLPESHDERILRAVAEVSKQQICQATLLGEEGEVRQHATDLGLDLSAVQIRRIDDSYAQRLFELRKAKRMTEAEAVTLSQNPNYFATLMVVAGEADGMVSGAANTTAETIRPALQIIKTKPGVSAVSGIFLMVLPDGTVWVFGDCAVNPNPDAQTLAEIAVVSAENAQRFGLAEPKVAMLSYATGDSAGGPDVELTTQALALAREMNPQLAIDGPIQFDAAVDPGVGEKKMPGSAVAGQANVFIFPNLVSGNITYKAVQRTSGAVAIGPVLQGLNAPVNDLSRGASVRDIVNTIAITAIMAQ